MRRCADGTASWTSESQGRRGDCAPVCVGGAVGAGSISGWRRDSNVEVGMRGYCDRQIYVETCRYRM